MKKSLRTPPRLIQCATPWGIMHYPSAKKEWSLERKIRAIKAAGFDGVAAIPDEMVAKLCRELGLELMGGMDGSNVAKARKEMVRQRDLGAIYLNVQLLDHDTALPKAAKTAAALVKAGDEVGVKVHIETHRDTSTETPEKYEEIARLFKMQTGRLMPTTWDHSHLAVIKHLQPADYAKRLLVWPKLIQASNIFHLRPFNGQHCQVPVTNGKGRLTPEFLDYLAFVEELLVCWLKGPRPAGQLWVCPELGYSHGYHVSTWPHPWEDAQVARGHYAKAWQRALKRVDG
ncbi:MAG: TIM barrel protein [Opitutaceae bacterium]|nr:TIM barrel protein [Cephaloticoccus sp.]MCP5529730.1 TIM barrel protein [Opitutaceae bacterium]